MPRAREDPERTRGILALIASLTLFAILNGDLLTSMTTFVVNMLGWDMIRRIAGVVIPLSILAVSAPQVSKTVAGLYEYLEEIMRKIDDKKQVREARAIMNKIYRLREKRSKR